MNHKTEGEERDEVASTVYEPNQKPIVVSQNSGLTIGLGVMVGGWIACSAWWGSRITTQIETVIFNQKEEGVRNYNSNERMNSLAQQIAAVSTDLRVHIESTKNKQLGNVP